MHRTPRCYSDVNPITFFQPRYLNSTGPPVSPRRCQRRSCECIKSLCDSRWRKRRRKGRKNRRKKNRLDAGSSRERAAFGSVRGKMLEHEPTGISTYVPRSRSHRLTAKRRERCRRLPRWLFRPGTAAIVRGRVAQ